MGNAFSTRMDASSGDRVRLWTAPSTQHKTRVTSVAFRGSERRRAAAPYTSRHIGMTAPPGWLITRATRRTPSALSRKPPT